MFPPAGWLDLFQWLDPKTEEVKAASLLRPGPEVPESRFPGMQLVQVTGQSIQGEGDRIYTWDG